MSKSKTKNKTFTFDVTVEVDVSELESYDYDEKLSLKDVKDAFVEIFDQGQEKLMDDVCAGAEQSDLYDSDKIAYCLRLKR